MNGSIHFPLGEELLQPSACANDLLIIKWLADNTRRYCLTIIKCSCFAYCNHWPSLSTPFFSPSLKNPTLHLSLFILPPISRSIAFAILSHSLLTLHLSFISPSLSISLYPLLNLPQVGVLSDSQLWGGAASPLPPSSSGPGGQRGFRGGLWGWRGLAPHPGPLATWASGRPQKWLPHRETKHRCSMYSQNNTLRLSKLPNQFTRIYID